MDADDLAEFESNSYYDREFEAKEDDGSLKEEEPRHPNDLGGALPPEQDLSLVPFVNEHHHDTTPSGDESLMQLNTAKRKLTGEEETSDSRKKQQLTNMGFRNSSTRPYSQMPQPPYQYPTLNQTTNRLAPQPPYQYPTLNQTTNRQAQPPYQYPTLNQTTNRQQDSRSQRGPNAAAPLQQRTQSQGRNQHSAHQRRQGMVNQNQRMNYYNPFSLSAADPTMYNQQIQYPQQNLSGQTPATTQDGTTVGRNHSNQPPGMQQGLPPRRPDMNQQTRMGINPNVSYLRFRYGYFSSGQAGKIDQQHSGPPMNIQEPSPDTTLLPEMNQQMQLQGESYNQGEQMQPQVPPQQRQETEPRGVNLESHLTKEDKDVGED